MVKHYYNDQQYLNFISNPKYFKSPDLLNTYLHYEQLFSGKIHKLKAYVLKIQNELINKLTLVEFKTLTYTDINVLPDYNMIQKTYDMRLTNAAIILNIPNLGRFTLPVKYKKKYHGSINYRYSFNAVNIRRQYDITLVFDTIKHEIKIVLTNDIPETIPLDFKTNKMEGVDINTRDNMFKVSDGNTIDYDRKLLNQIVKDKIKLDKIVEQRDKLGCDKKYSDTMLKIQDSINKRVKYLQDFNCSLFLNQYRDYHLAFENIQLKPHKTKGKSKENDDINYNNIFSLLRFSSIKDTIIRMAPNYGVEISLINPDYTSQMCNKCYHIEEANRHGDKFKCKSCGHEDNADLNAAKNIRDRIAINVLCNALHQKNDNSENTYNPIYKNTKRDRIIFKQELDKSLNILKKSNPLYQNLILNLINILNLKK